MLSRSASFAASLVLPLLLAACGPDDRNAPDAGADAGAADAGKDGGPLPPVDAGPDDAGPPDAGPPDAGLCPEDCSTIEAPVCMRSVCNDGSWPGAVGECVMIPVADGTPCDDGNFCTVDDACMAGACVGGGPNDCGMVPGPCQEVVCDPVAETCRAEGSPALNGTPCEYPDLCVTGTVCEDGLCTGGTRMDCSSTPVPNECQLAYCNPTTGACELMNTNEGMPCIDPANPCIADNVCTAGVCGGGSTPTDCSSLNSQCSVGMCNPADGSCVAVPTNEGMPCDDGIACTSDTVCISGTCAGGTAPPCSMTPDGCCPPTCSDSDDADCGCPGILLGSTCVYAPSTTSAPDQAAARAVCTGLGPGWGLCHASTLCMEEVMDYLGSLGCSCGTADTCACGSAANIYIHAEGAGTRPYYLRGPQFPGCFTATSCIDSVTEVCGTPLCCRGAP